MITIVKKTRVGKRKFINVLDYSLTDMIVFEHRL